MFKKLLLLSIVTAFNLNMIAAEKKDNDVKVTARLEEYEINNSEPINELSINSNTKEEFSTFLFALSLLSKTHGYKFNITANSETTAKIVFIAPKGSTEPITLKFIKKILLHIKNLSYTGYIEKEIIQTNVSEDIDSYKIKTIYVIDIKQKEINV